ncbi:MAG: hypothetical protein V3V41_00905 [Candidatus Heimdallarchaeota archaeon]
MPTIEDDQIEVRMYRTWDQYIIWQYGNIPVPSNATLMNTFWLHKGEVWHCEWGMIQRHYDGTLSLYDSVYDVHTTACIDEPTIHGEVVNVQV